VRKGDDLTIFIVPTVEKIRSLDLQIPKGLLRPVAGKLYLYLYKDNNMDSVKIRDLVRRLRANNRVLLNWNDK
jgi:hypothetical protein